MCAQAALVPPTSRHVAMNWAWRSKRVFWGEDRSLCALWREAYTGLDSGELLRESLCLDPLHRLSTKVILTQERIESAAPGSAVRVPRVAARVGADPGPSSPCAPGSSR